MTKRRLLFGLTFLVLVNLVLVNQVWVTANAGESASALELTGTKVANLASPVLSLMGLTAFIGSYASGKATSVLLTIETALLATVLVGIVLNLQEPAAIIADSGLIEKITGQTGTTPELISQLSNVAITPSFAASAVGFLALLLWSLFSSLSSWRWQKIRRTSKASTSYGVVEKKGTSKAKNSFDLWDSQR